MLSRTPEGWADVFCNTGALLAPECASGVIAVVVVVVAAVDVVV
jgi:hypothetical protein